MKPTRRPLLIWLVCLVGGGLSGHALLTERTSAEAASPDGRYVANVNAAFPLFGDYRYNIKIKGTDGQLVRHLIIHDKIFGWGRDPSVTWSSDSKTMTVGLHDGDADIGPARAHKRLSIDVQ
jgi:hypothetical protein